MSFGERRYRRYFEKADYGKFRNAIYDILNKRFGFMPSTVFKYEKEMLEKLKTQKCVVLPEQRSTDYYEGFYDAAQLIMAALKARERG